MTTSSLACEVFWDSAWKVLTCGRHSAFLFFLWLSPQTDRERQALLQVTTSQDQIWTWIQGNQSSQVEFSMNNVYTFIPLLFSFENRFSQSKVTKNGKSWRDPNDRFCSFESTVWSQLCWQAQEGSRHLDNYFFLQASSSRISRNRLLSTIKQVTQSVNKRVAMYPKQWKSHLPAEAAADGIIRLTLDLGSV